MADPTVEMGYEEMIASIAGGRTHYNEAWLEWYGARNGATFQDRIRQTFLETGRLPSLRQYEFVRAEAARASAAADRPAEGGRSVVQPEKEAEPPQGVGGDGPAPKKRTAKKGAT